MVDVDIARRGIRDERVLAALRQVPREAFVDQEFAKCAYQDAPLPIGHGQTISQPLIVATMAEAARIGPTDRVLEVGTGSGYVAAVLGELAAAVFTVERHRELAERAEDRLRSAGHGNVTVRTGDGTRGWPEEAPFDAIVVSAAGPSVPRSLKEQLRIGGRLVIPVGSRRGEQRLLRLTRASDDRFEEEDLGGVRFVPLIGDEGWIDQGSGAAPA